MTSRDSTFDPRDSADRMTSAVSLTQTHTHTHAVCEECDHLSRRSWRTLYQSSPL